MRRVLEEEFLDGEWHEVDEAADAIAAIYTPRKALAWYEAQYAKQRRIRNARLSRTRKLSLPDRIHAARRQIVMHHLTEYKKRGELVEYESGVRFRLSREESNGLREDT